MIEFRKLEPQDIEVRVQQVNEKGCSLLLYKTARCDMRILDEAVGAENWDCSYEEIGGKLFCTVGIRCGEDGSTFGSWVYKQDVGTESDMEAAKGEASDAFKRACVKWGIGRELYTAPFVWVQAGQLQTLAQDQRSGKWRVRDRFKVSRIEYDEDRISGLEISNQHDFVVYRMK